MKPKAKRGRIPVELIALGENSERWRAKMAALHPAVGWGLWIPAGDSRSSARFLRLVADALESKFQATDARRRIIESHWNAGNRHARCKGGLDVSRLVEGPTLDEV